MVLYKGFIWDVTLLIEAAIGRSSDLQESFCCFHFKQLTQLNLVFFRVFVLEKAQETWAYSSVSQSVIEDKKQFST
ncbi:hypothetical protein AY600_01035 [Phormidium willei BDU 130791]|nr:hypothetical protein AY600_01035 [Phormidium willei BDU 130791]